MRRFGIGSKAAGSAIALVVLGVGLAGCAELPADQQDAVMTPELLQQLQAQGTTPSSVTPGMLRQDGLMKNGLLPEQWGDTN